MYMGSRHTPSWHAAQQRQERRHTVDPTTVCCPNPVCPARGQIRQGNIRLHSRQEKRFLCTPCRKTFAATQGTVFYRLRTSTALVVTVVTVLAPGCPVHAVVAALGFDERTSAAWWARGARPLVKPQSGDDRVHR